MLVSTRLLQFSCVFSLSLACSSTPEPTKAGQAGAGPTATGGTDASGGTAGATPVGAGGSSGTMGAGAGTGGTGPAGSGGSGVPSVGGMGAAGAGGTTGGDTSMGGMAVTAGSAGLGAVSGSGSASGAGGAGGTGAGMGGMDAMAASGGMDTSAGTGGTSAGMSGSAGAAPTGGAAEISVPFTAYKATQSFEIYLNSATNLSTATVSVVMRKVSGKAGGVQVVLKNGSAQNYAYAQNAWTAINDLTSSWATVTLDATTATAGTDPFDATMVTIIAIQLNAGDPWYTDPPDNTVVDTASLINPTVLDIDSITVTGASVGPWNFDLDTSPFVVNIGADGLAATPPYAVDGSTATWLAF